MKLVDHFINTVAEELDHLNGTDFEELCRPLIELLTGKEYEWKGHNLELKAVKGSVDLIQDEDYRTIGQCGTDKDYFSGDKPKNDIESSIKNSPEFTTIYLFSNRRAKGDEYQNVKATIWQTLKDKLNSGYHYYLYDSQRIAKAVYNKIYLADKVEEILSYLPQSQKYYYLLPQTNTLPLQKSYYQHRPEEKDIEELLKEKDFIQIYGLSGIGKSQMTISIANDLAEHFDTVLWFDGNSIVPNDLKKASLRRMGEDINLASILQMFKILVIVDNLNESVGDLLDSFGKYNGNGSKCIVSSLQRNVGVDESYNLSYVSDEVSRAILFDCDVKPTEFQVKSILKQIAGYPLLLELAKNAVVNEEMSWDDIISVSNMTEINDDERNEEFAQRIVGRYKERFLDMFNLLLGLDSTTVNKIFLKEKNLLKLNALYKFAIIQDAGDYQCQIHQVVLSAIRAVVGKDYDGAEFADYLQKYLQKHVAARDEGLYTFFAYHQKRIGDIASAMQPESLLRHYILLAHLYSVDTFVNPDIYLDKINTLPLIPENQEVDLCLLVEKQELEQYITRKETNEDKEKSKAKILEDIETLKALSLSSSASQAIVCHHIGKWLSTIEDYEQSELWLLKSLELNPKSYHSLLRLARDYNKQNLPDKAAEKIAAILNPENINEVPISIRLSAYGIISNYKYKELQKTYIDEQLDQFSKDVYASLSESYSHTYIVLAKMAEHLSYNNPKFYARLCVQLPLPLNIEKNNRLRKDYGKIKLAQYLYGNYPPEYKEKLFRITQEYLAGLPREDDYIRKDLIKLYLAGGVPEKALPIAEELEKKDNMFMQQTLCKVYYGNRDYPAALGCIEKAIAQENPKQKEYCAAFRHDKAKCLHKLNEANAADVMAEAISIQPNEKLKEEWSKELAGWAIG